MRRFSIPLLLGLLALCPAQAADAPKAPAKKTAAKKPAPARTAPRAGMLPKGTVVDTIVTAPAPRDPVVALLDQARDAQSRGEMELALRLTQAAIVADPARPSSYVALGDLYSAQGQVAYARAYYDEALEIDPSDAAAGRAQAALANPPKATAANTP